MARRSARHFLWARLLFEGVAPLGAPHAAFLSLAPCFRAATGPEPGPRSGQLPPPFVAAASSHLRQPVVMPADDWPGPPECGVTSPARGRRIQLHHRDVSRRRPQSSRTLTMIRARVGAGISWPIFFRRSFRDAPKAWARSPGVMHEDVALDSGFAASRRPGMTVESPTLPARSGRRARSRRRARCGSGRPAGRG